MTLENKQPNYKINKRGMQMTRTGMSKSIHNNNDKNETHEPEHSVNLVQNKSNSETPL